MIRSRTSCAWSPRAASLRRAAPIIDALAAARQAADQARAAGGAARDACDPRRRGTGGFREPSPRPLARLAPRPPSRPGAPPPPPSPGPPRRLRVQVRDSGRTVVDLQLPGVLAELAGAVPGIPSDYVDRVREALRTGIRGPIIDVTDEDGSGVTITVD